ncbi:hypothetical protein F0357_10460 [Rhizobiales bacterium Sp-1]|uniref:Uncharacterized protein n=1 Tax=Segnochrobactrum spirostomi TaxID=2608987 RepID=A0A6A7Y223_9HYPH|nr:hypothetical protein [Segnochrobactrum spirostomi]
MRREAAASIASEPCDEHAAYIASLLKAPKDDKRFIFQAASHAQCAVGFLHGCQRSSTKTTARRLSCCRATSIIM